MSIQVRILVFMLTLITFIALICFAIYGLVLGSLITFVVCAVLAAFFGVMCVGDVKYFQEKK
jgi:hypothetical protein